MGLLALTTLAKKQSSLKLSSHYMASCVTTLPKHNTPRVGLGGHDHGWSNPCPVTTRHWVPQPSILKAKDDLKKKIVVGNNSLLPLALPITSISHTAVVESRVNEFDPSIPIKEAWTPPSSWYTDPTFHSLELDRVFYQGWQVVGHSYQIKDVHDYFTGRLGNVEYVVCRDGDGEIHAFHNVCRHHASLVASGSGKKSCFEFGLVPLRVAIWGPFVLANFDKSDTKVDYASLGRDWLGDCSQQMSAYADDSSLGFLCRREYTIESNWKVFCDNYLDGGYHVPYAHKVYASGINFETYSLDVFEKVIVQQCASSSSKPADGFNRLGSGAFYAFVYPNFILERFGPWMITNLILPLGHRKCKIVFDFFIDESMKDDKAFIDRSINISDLTQMEDVMLCESVQRGVESPAFCSGRYVEPIEKGMHHFHCLLHNSLTGQRA